MLLPRAAIEAAFRRILDLGARYADVRATITDQQRVRIRNGAVDLLSETSDLGIGVRVLVRNGWGFAAESEMTVPALERAALRAVELARASDLCATREIILGAIEPREIQWASPYLIDPWSVPLEAKIAHLLEATEPLRSDSRIHQAIGEISLWRQRKLLATTEGSFIEQLFTQTGGGVEAVAIGEGEFQRRSWPNPMGGDYQAAGWELIEQLALPREAHRVRDELLALLNAPAIQPGRHDLIIGSSQLALQVHESCGHPSELDRALGWEISQAGGSFLEPSMLGNFRYGSDLVTIVGDATIPGALGSFAFDDDGVPGQRFPIIDRGIFVNYLTGRDTAPLIGRVSNGTVRGETGARLPIIRMTNINLEPGTTPLEEILATTKRGILVDTNKSWSIDDLRLNFQFGCEIAWEIENGRIGRILRNPLYTGSTPAFWQSCDAVSDANSWRLWGLPNCGKGDPLQVARVAHGAPVARFRQVEMG